MKLSEHFNLEEFTKSSTAEKHKINNTPSAQHLSNLKAVVDTILEPVRKHFNKPIKINSGYRGPELNKAVGGASSSQHCNGEAVDFEIEGIPNKTVADWVTENLPFDQCILEFYNPKEGANSGWVHVSYKKTGQNRKQKLIAEKDGTKTVYKPVNDFDATNDYNKYKK